MADSALVLLEGNSAESADRAGNVRHAKETPAAEQPLVQKAFQERIKVVGIGGGGNNALDHIIRTGATGVEFLAVNTDANCLDKCLSMEKLILGEKLTHGHGAGGKPEIGERAALESRDAIRDCLKGCDMVYLAAGMGGGTGTGALPVVASIAKDMGILTVAVVTWPFTFEGKRRLGYAEQGIGKVKESVDALIVVHNSRLLDLSERTTSLTDAFAMADNVLKQAVQGVTDLVTKPGFINVDFADLKNIMQHAGGAVMGIGLGTGEHRASDAMKRATESPLMGASIHGARGVILNVTASPNVGIIEVRDAASRLQDMVDPEANFIWGLVYDENMGEAVQMVVIGTGFGFDGDGSGPYYQGGRGDTQKPAAPLSQPARAGSESFFSVESPIDTPSYLRYKEHK